MAVESNGLSEARSLFISVPTIGTSNVESVMGDGAFMAMEIEMGFAGEDGIPFDLEDQIADYRPNKQRRKTRRQRIKEAELKKVGSVIIPGVKEDKSKWYRVRKTVKSPELYMQSDGKWGPWKTAKRFRTQDDAERFAEAHTKDHFGLFNHEN